MKNFITIINLCIIFGITTMVTRMDKISKELTNTPVEENKIVSPRNSVKKNKPKVKEANVSFTSVASAEPVDESVSDFIKEMSQARMLDLEEGKIAAQRCTSKNLKQYGSLMVDDQNKMLEDLKKLATLKDVSIDNALSPDRSEELNNLKGMHGRSFDKKFVKMMTNDHKRDVRIFREATLSQDADVQVFATKYLPVIESHLAKITSLRR